MDLAYKTFMFCWLATMIAVICACIEGKPGIQQSTTHDVNALGAGLQAHIDNATMKAADRIVGVNKEIQKHTYEKLEHSTQNNGIGQWACVLGLSIREVSVMFMAFLKARYK